MSHAYANRRIRERLNLPPGTHLTILRQALKTRGIRVSRYCTSHIFEVGGKRVKAIVDHKRHQLVTIIRL